MLARGVLPAIALCTVASPTSAQPTDFEAIVRVMRQCARISDVAARVACYDNTIDAEAAIASGGGAIKRQPDPSPRPTAPLAQSPSPPPARAAAPSQRAAPQGFGSESLPQRRTTEAERPPELQSSVAAAVEREPGIYLLTLSDNSQWQMVEPAPRSYDPPRAGSSVIISRGALGGFFLNVGRQTAVRVRRIR